MSASKGSSAYQVHTYPTKVPPTAIEPFIEASTQPGGTVLDPFCGSGMTGLAAQNIGRSAILSDLAPGAVHLAHNHTHPVAPEHLLDAVKTVSAAMTALERELYRSSCPTCGADAMLRHLVWSDVHVCDACDEELRVWDATDSSGSSSRTISCSCGHTQQRSGRTAHSSVPVEKAVACTSCGTLQRGDVDETDLALLQKISRKRVTKWVPSIPLGADREMYRRSALHLHGVSNVADFWTIRSKLALSALWDSIGNESDTHVRDALRFAFTNTAWHATRMRRYNARGGQRPLTGTLYIPQLIAEGNVFEIFRNQAAQVARFYGTHPALGLDDYRVLARQASATDLSWLPAGSVDYVFTDPPFGANLFYGDCNIVWESWLGDITDVNQEIVVNRSLPVAAGGKNLGDYERLLGSAFSEVSRVLAPGARVSVVFHNADDRVWSALLAATSSAGLAQTNVALLNKSQRSMKGYKGRFGAEMVPFYDLIITFEHTSTRATHHLNGAGAIALEAVHEHLLTLPDDTHGTPNHKRSLEYLYSLSVGAVIGSGAAPKGLSYQAVRTMLEQNLRCNDGFFYTDATRVM